jgi:hypothetical protein
VTGHERRRHASGFEHAQRGDADRQHGGLGVLGERQLVLGPLEAQARERLKVGPCTGKSGVGFGKRRARLGKRLGEGPAHADPLRSLPWKHEGNHAWGPVSAEPAAAAMSRSTRSRNRLVTKRCAAAMALRTALADERPWPTMARPATPSSGAPPYSE